MKRVLSGAKNGLFLELYSVRRVRVAAVRHLDDGLELVRFRNVVRGFKIFTFRGEGESLTRATGSHCFNFYNGVRWHGTRLLALVVEKETEARRRIGFKDGDFNKTVAEVHEEAIVWSAFDFFRGMRMVPIFAVKAPNPMR